MNLLRSHNPSDFDFDDTNTVGLVKSQQTAGTVKSSRCKAREY
jgi:hypothetical protein